ncbi:MAG: glycosyltransferase family 4 protein [Ilumatobacteraceae bacterium]
MALVTGICVENDAISSAVISQARLLLTMPEIESVDIFSQHFDADLDLGSHTLTTSWDLIRHPVFATADVAIFHWGIHYSLFDATIVVAAEARAGRGPVPVVHFHNCTPREFVDPQDYATIDRSMLQLQLVPSLDLQCWTFSAFNEATLADLGVPRSHIHFVPFPIAAPRPLRPNRRVDGVDIAVVGRIVRAKGHHVVLDALALLPPWLRDVVQVRIAGNTSFSSVAYRDELTQHVLRLGLDGIVQFIGQPDTDDLWALYERSHLLVSASLHEGLCIPVIEAYMAQCRVVGVSAGNLPYVVQPPDRLAAPDDPESLAEAISKTAAEILTGTTVDRRPVEALLDQFTERSTTEHLRAGLASLLDGAERPQGASR